jgi:hypothetical protein
MLRGLNQLGGKGVLEPFLNSYLNSAEHKGLWFRLKNTA